MGMTAILFNGTEPFEQIVNTLSTDGPMWNLVKTAQAILEKKTFKNNTTLHMYMAQGQVQITPNFGRPWVNYAIYQDSVSKFSWFWRRRVFKCFYHIWAWHPSCSMVPNHSKKLSIPIQQKAPCGIWWKLLKQFLRRRHLILHNFIYVYSPGARADNPQNFDDT